MLQIHDEKVPLSTDESGMIYVARTRVTLECVAEMFEEGASPEEITQEYDALRLDDVYAVITYLLRNREAVDAYLVRHGISHERVGHERPAQSRSRIIEERFPPTLRSKLLQAKRNKEISED